MKLGISGSIAKSFQNSAITPLLALVGLLLGVLAIIITPKEEEPQIEVTFANVFVPFPGASAQQVEQLVAIPAEQVLAEIKGVDDIFSISSPGLAVLTVAFEVGVAREQAILNLHNQVQSHSDWFPDNLGVLPPVVKPMGIEDVPVLAITLSSNEPDLTAAQLTQLAHALELELKQVAGTRNIYTIGGQQQVAAVRLNPAKMNGHGLAFDDIRQVLLSANAGGIIQPLVQDNQVIQVQTGQFLQSVDELGQLVVGSTEEAVVYLADVADIQLQGDTPEQMVYSRLQAASPSVPAVTLAIAKQPGANAVKMSKDIEQRLAQLTQRLIPEQVQVAITRDYGLTAQQKSQQLMSKLLFATVAVVVLVLFALNWRAAVIVGAAIVITLALTLFASWAWGFTLNRVSLFALIFSIGILVDDAIVVVENIARHQQLKSGDLLDIIPQAVAEVGGPTILATFTVIAALLPMAFVSGLMGPYMSPIPINASTGMFISLLVAFVVTPWLSYRLLKPQTTAQAAESAQSQPLYGFFNALMRPFLEGQQAANKRKILFLLVLGLIALALALPIFKVVALKMMPFDNKSEFQVVVDMPEGTAVEHTLVVLNALADELQQVAEVDNLQLYAGTSAPMNFNGLVRQYYLRSEAHQGDIQVNLVDKSQRQRPSHEIALSVRAPLQNIGRQFNANVKVVEVPPGPPVMAPIVAEIYGNHYGQQMAGAKQLRALFENTADVVDVDDWVAAPQEKWFIEIDRSRASRLGVNQASIVQAINTALGGEDVSYLHTQQNKYPLPIRLELPEGSKVDLHQLLLMKVRAQNGQLVAIADLVQLHKGNAEQKIYHKNLQPVVFVTADSAGRLDSPLYGLYAVSSTMAEQGMPWSQHWIRQPASVDDIAVKWDGEWQITYETFRDMGMAYALGMVLIYLLVVGHFRSYWVPLVIMAPIPLTIIGVMPGHALLGAHFTATSMIGMIALAGIIVRNSILLVDFIHLELEQGVALADALIRSAAVRSRPIALTAVAAMLGAFFILDDPIFNGLAIALIFGILVSTLLTLIIIPLLYYAAFHKQLAPSA